MRYGFREVIVFGQVNSFKILPANPTLSEHEQDDIDAASLFDMLEKEVIPLYYDDQPSWVEMIKQSMRDIALPFGSNRMATEYYQKIYNCNK